eukprot:3669455-Prymnesium_polylepis.1
MWPKTAPSAPRETYLASLPYVEAASAPLYAPFVETNPVGKGERCSRTRVSLQNRSLTRLRRLEFRET